MAEKNKTTDIRKTTMKAPVAPSFLDHGRVPPQAVDLEEAVLGAIMLERNAMIQVMGIMDASQFYKEAHQVIFKAIKDIFSNGDPVDILTIINHLRSTGELDTVGGAYYITQLTNRVASSANIEFHSRIIQQKFIQRELIRVCSEIIKDSFEDSEEVFDLLASAQDKMMNVFSFASGDTKDINVAIKEVLDQIDHNLSQDEVATGIPSGFNEYDKFSYGFHDGDLVIIAAEKSNGKTSIAMQMARHASVVAGKKVGIFSYEMTMKQLAARMMSMDLEIDGKRLLYGRLENAELSTLHQKISKLSSANIFIDECKNRTFEYLANSIRMMKMKQDIDMVVIDYLQLIKLSRRTGNQHEETREIVNGIKEIAKNCDIPILLLSQFSRGDGPRPNMNRLKGSGDIENAADVVWMQWRPSLYGLSDVECGNYMYSATEGLTHVIIGKGRNIGTTEFLLDFIPEQTMYTEYDSGINTNPF